MLLQKDDMEHIMNLRLRWKVQAIGQSAHTFHHLEQAEEPWRELGLGLVCNASCRATVKAQPDPITHLKS